MKASDVFVIGYGHSLELNRQEQNVRGVNFVSRTAKNNGVSAIIEPILGLDPAPAGTISVALGGSVLATFLQPKPYYCGYHVAVLTPKNPAMTETEKLWWAAVITANRYRYSFGRQANRTLATLELPESIPAWVYETPIPDVSTMAAPAGVPVDLTGSDTWGEFRIDELFAVDKGSRLTKANMIAGDNLYIGASEYRNGVTAHVGNDTQFPGGSISVPYNGSVANAFYQPADYLAGDDVHGLVPITDAGPTSAEASLFVATVIRQEKPRYNYGRKWGLEKMRETVIRLPQTTAGDPDWAYMEAYIKGLGMSSVFAAQHVGKLPETTVATEDGTH